MGHLVFAAIQDVTNKLLQQGDRTRIQIQPVLPLPAAFAWGYELNIRVARLGVWARRIGESDFKRQLWLSDGEHSHFDFPINWFVPLKPGIRSVIVELTIGIDIHSAVQEFIERSNIHIDSWLQFGKVASPPSSKNIDERFALAYANEVGRMVRDLNQSGILDMHLFLRMPSSLAVLIGQRLAACGRLHLYWFDNPTYKYAFSLH